MNCTPRRINRAVAMPRRPSSPAAWIFPCAWPFPRSAQPTLLIWGHEAYYTPVAEAADLLYRHPESRLVFLDECGMLPHDEKAGEFLELVRDFRSGFGAGEAAA